MALSPQFGDITPSQSQQTLASNYLNFAGANGVNFFLVKLFESFNIFLLIDLFKITAAA